MALTDYVAVNDLTVLLALVSATLFVLRSVQRPRPLVHPILLGRQSDVSRVRTGGESAVYRNYGTGLMGRLPFKPNKDLNILQDILKLASDVPRTLWSTKITISQLSARVTALGTGLVRIADLTPHKTTALICLDDSIEYLLSDLALSAHSIVALTLSSASLLVPALEAHHPDAIITSAAFLGRLLDVLARVRKDTRHTIIVVDLPDGDAPADAALHRMMGSIEPQHRVLSFAALEADGAKMDPVVSTPPQPGDVTTMSIFLSKTGGVAQAVQFTHENITAGIVAVRGLFPLSNALSSLDTIASCHSLSTAYGRAVMYTALFEGVNFATLRSSKIFDATDDPKYVLEDVASVWTHAVPPPTVYFLRPEHLDALTASILAHARGASLLYGIAWRHKLAGVREGFITKESLWDRLVFDAARARVVGAGAGTIREVIVSGGALHASILEPARVAFSVPVVNAYDHPAVAGPVLASHPLDLQNFYSGHSSSGTGTGKGTHSAPALAGAVDPYPHVAHVGPPSLNVEAKLMGVDDDAVEGGADPMGLLLVRGPSVGVIIGVGGGEDAAAVRGHEGAGDADGGEGWVDTGEKAGVLKNGTFKILSRQT